MKFLHLNFATLLLRFYLLMAVVVIAFFAGIPWLAILALPIFFSALMGIEFKNKSRGTAPKKETSIRTTVRTQPQPSH